MMESSSKFPSPHELESCQSDDNKQNNVTATIARSAIGKMCIHGDVAIIASGAGHDSQSEPELMEGSINNFRQPPEEFVEYAAFTEIETQLTAGESFILHLHGFPGTGKSAVVRKLAAEFPFSTQEKSFIKYLIECSDSSENIGDSLKVLVKQMWECKLVSDEASCNRAREQLSKKRTVGFVELLVEAAIPVLIVIEDPPEGQIEILNDLVMSFHSRISSKIKKPLNNDIHLCITSQSKRICKFSCDQWCKKVRVDGLTEEEGLKLLSISDKDSQTERDAALKVISDLHGSPLGLIAVRATCRKSRLSYEEYGHLRDVCLHKEIEHLKEELGPQIKHIYQTIVTLLNEKGMWETMKVLSFFHHGAIPQRLIGMVKLRQQTTNDLQSYVTHLKIKQESGIFISRLEDFAICEVNGDKYDETTITLHQVVFHSVQSYITDQLPALRQAIFSLASLVQKDIRTQKKYKFVLSMIPHILSVIQFVDLHPDVCNDFVTSMAVVHLREVYGNAAKHFDSVAAQESLTTCARIIWNEISKRCDMQRDLDDMLSATYVPATEIAQPIFEACLAAGDHLQSDKDLLDRYTCVTMQFKPGDHDAHSNPSASQEVIERLKLLSKYSLQLSPDELRNFRRLEDGKLFLDIKTHCQVFFIDRLVSVLYSLARVAQYDHHVTEVKKAKFVRISDVTHELCKPCRQRTGVNLLYLHLSAVSRVSVRLRNFSKIDFETKKDVLLDARNVVENNFKNLRNDADVPFYENGLKATMEENTYDELINLRAMIRIHTKFLPLCSDEEEVKLVKQNADQFYEKLCDQARTNIERWTLSAKCLVYCGKYMASRGNYSKAIEHFLEVLTCKAVVGDKARLFPWVCYNYARATAVGKSYLHVQHSLNKGREALNCQSDIPVDLTSKLKEQTDRLASFEQ